MFDKKRSTTSFRTTTISTSLYNSTVNNNYELIMNLKTKVKGIIEETDV